MIASSVLGIGAAAAQPTTSEPPPAPPPTDAPAPAPAYAPAPTSAPAYGPAPTSAPAPAYATAPAPEPLPAAPRRASISLSPIHAIALTMAELHLEVRPAPKVGIAVIGGLGRISSGGVTATATEIGGQVTFYPMRDFAGLHVGAEVLYVHLGDVMQDSSVTADGLSVGGLVGWKYVHSSGFTFLAQGGVAVAEVQAKSTTSSAGQKGAIPLLNLNLGWSF